MARPLVLLVAVSLPACASADDPVPAPEVHVVVDAAIPTGHPEGPRLAIGGARVVASGAGAPAAFAVDTLSDARVWATADTRLAGGRPVSWRVRTALATPTGDTIWRAVDDVLLRPDGPRETVRPRLQRAGRDVLLARIVLAPRDTTITAGDSLRVRALAYDAEGFTIAGAPLGWRSRDASATVGATGTVRAVSAGRSWIVARAWNGVADSMTVGVVAPR